MYKKILFDTVSRLVNGQNLTDGIEFRLTGISDGESHQSEYKFTFNVKFTKDVSYQQSALDILLYDVIDTAIQLLSLEEFRYDIELIGDDLETYNIGQDLYDSIDKGLSTINQIVMKNNYDSVKLDVEHVRTRLMFTDENSFLVLNYVKPISGYFCDNDNDNKCRKVGIKEATHEYIMYRDFRPYDDSDFNYQIIDEIIDGFKSFIDNNQVIYVLTQFVM